MKFLTPALLFIGSMGLCGLANSAVKSQNVPILPSPSPAGFFPAPHFHLLGPASCASMACHNSQAATGPTGREYTIWIDKDKHAQAYNVLGSERSRYIQKNLEHAADISKVHPEKNPLCLKCHAHPHAGSASLPVDSLVLTEGVSCESCHGPAEKWVTEHYRESWQEKSAEEKQALGMYDTRSILGRARLCIDCHVGSPGNDANHDLLAAGHPPLKFDFGAFHANMPHHWLDAKDKDPDIDPRGHPDFEARAWVVGQALTAEAWMNLLSFRAGEKKLPWPEFASYDCYACHHDLTAPSWRQARGYKGRMPGSIPWDSWYTCMTTDALGGKDDAGRLKNLVDKIKVEMEKPRPNRDKVAQMAADAARRLHSWPGKLDQPVPVQKLFWKIVRADSGNANKDWDHASQVFNALAALHNAWADLDQQPPSPERLNVRRQLVAFGRKLPMLAPFESPRGFDPRSIAEPLRKLKDMAPQE